MEAESPGPHMHDVPAPKPATTDAPSGGTGKERVLHVSPDHPIEVSFSFERPQSRVGISASVLSHIALALIAFVIMRYQPEAVSLDIPEEKLPNEIVWLNVPGPGGGGGGGGNKAPDPPKKIELPGRERITVPVPKEPEPKLEPPPEEPKPLEEINIPAKSMAHAEQMLPGAVQSVAPQTTSQGSGEGGGGGTGKGGGSGSGDGSGLGPGFGKGTGGGAYRPGSGVSTPRLLQEVKPQYTADAMRAKVQGSVWLECIVMPDGSVGQVRVTKSLDSVFGLDQEAIKAARQWKFMPGMRQGEPVPVLITIELTFTLR